MKRYLVISEGDILDSELYKFLERLEDAQKYAKTNARSENMVIAQVLGYYGQPPTNEPQWNPM